MKRSAALLAVLVLSSSVAACGDDPGQNETVSSSTSASPSAGPSSPPAASPTVVPSATPTSSGGDGDAPEPFPADTGTDVADPTGGPLSVRAVRVARQEGFDRVVFELAGKAAGQAGWRVEYVDSPTQQGSGDPVDVAGEAALSVLITGTGYPMDTGVEEVSEDPALPPDLTVVEDVVLGAVFEGQYEAHIGTGSRAPFRVFRLGDPERVVVDVRAP